MTRLCEGPALVGGRFWLPLEPFEFGWDIGVGCNDLRCVHCHEQVRSEVLSGMSRRYWCGCREYEVAWSYHIDDEQDDLYPPFTGWACGGHPDFRLPTTLDGVWLAGHRTPSPRRAARGGVPGDGGEFTDGSSWRKRRVPR